MDRSGLCAPMPESASLQREVVSGGGSITSVVQKIPT